MKQEVKARTYEIIMEHLHKAGNDPRGREQRRVKIALRNIKKFSDRAEKEVTDGLNGYI